MLFYKSSVPAKKHYYDEAQYWCLTYMYQQGSMSCSEETAHSSFFMHAFFLLRKQLNEREFHRETESHLALFSLLCSYITVLDLHNSFFIIFRNICTMSLQNL